MTVSKSTLSVSASIRESMAFRESILKKLQSSPPGSPSLGLPTQSSSMPKDLLTRNYQFS